MPPSDIAVVRKNTHLTNARAKELTADGIQTAVRNVGKDKLAKACDVKERTVEKWMAEGSLPDIDCLLNMADADPAVIRPILAEKGWILTPAKSRAANDMELAAGLGHGLSELIDRLRDGHRSHVDTAVLAALFRDLIPQMQVIVDEDDARKAA
jgi:hypothetical protein